jgi:hypothetical protein
MNNIEISFLLNQTNKTVMKKDNPYDVGDQIPNNHCRKKQLGKDIVISVGYTFLVVALVYFDIARLPSQYF